MPGSKTVLFSAFDNVGFLRGRIEAVDVATGARKVVIPFGTDPAYMTSGFLTYAVANALTDAQSRFRGSLRVVRFDASRVETVGESVPAFEPIFMGSTGAGNYGLSRRGDLVFVPGNTQANIAATPQRTLTWVDRAGKETPITAQPRGYAMGRISPDGRKIALDVRDQTNDVWIWDIDRQMLTSLNRDPGQDLSPIWTPDSQRIIWTSTRTGSNPNLYWQKADGTGAAESLTKAPGNQFPTTMTPDGKTVLLFGAGDSAARGMDIFAVDVSSPDRKAKPLHHDERNRFRSRICRRTENGSPTIPTNQVNSRSMCVRFPTCRMAGHRSRPTAAPARRGRATDASCFISTRMVS